MFKLRSEGSRNSTGTTHTHTEPIRGFRPCVGSSSAEVEDFLHLDGFCIIWLVYWLRDQAKIAVFIFLRLECLPLDNFHSNSVKHLSQLIEPTNRSVFEVAHIARFCRVFGGTCLRCLFLSITSELLLTSVMPELLLFRTNFWCCLWTSTTGILQFWQLLFLM